MPRKDPEKRREYGRAYWADPHGRAVKQAQLRRWQKNNPERIAAIRRKAMLKKNYGLTDEEYEAMVAAQGGACAICGTVAKLVVDHNHETGKIRALLCHKCNRGLGHFNESPELMAAAIEYLRNHARDYDHATQRYRNA
jgi:hypothetical protein